MTSQGCHTDETLLVPSDSNPNGETSSGWQLVVAYGIEGRDNLWFEKILLIWWELFFA